MREFLHRTHWTFWVAAVGLTFAVLVNLAHGEGWVALFQATTVLFLVLCELNSQQADRFRELLDIQHDLLMTNWFLGQQQRRIEREAASDE